MKQFHSSTKTSYTCKDASYHLSGIAANTFLLTFGKCLLTLEAIHIHCTLMLSHKGDALPSEAHNLVHTLLLVQNFA